MADLEKELARLPAAIEKLTLTNKQAAEDAVKATKKEGDTLSKALEDADKKSVSNKKNLKAMDRMIASGRLSKESLKEIEVKQKELVEAMAEDAVTQKSAADGLNRFMENQANAADVARQTAEATAKWQQTSAGQAVALKGELESQGKVADDNKEYQKLAFKARKADFKQRLKDATSPAAKKQIKEDAKNDAKANGSRLDKIGAGISGLWSLGKKGAKAAALGGLAILSTLAIGAFMIALGKFLQSDTFKKMTKYISKTILPALSKFWDFIKNNWEVIAGLITGIVAVLAVMKVVALFKKIKAGYLALKAKTIEVYLDPLKNMLKGAWTKILAVWGLIKKGFLALKAATIANVLAPLKNAVLAAGGKIWTFMKLIPPALIALKLFFLSTFLPAVTSFMVPLLPFIAIAAAIGVVLYALWEAFKDAKKTFDETGSIGESLKVGISKFIATIVGFIPMLVLKLVSWVAGMFGFDDFASQVDAIDPIQWISDHISDMISAIVDWFVLLFNDPVKAIKDLVKGYISLFTDFGGFIYKKAIKPAIDWIFGLFGVKDASGQMETYVGKQLDKLLNFAGAIYDKYIKPIVDWVTNLFSSTVKSVKESAAGKMIGGAIDTAKNFMKTALRAVLPDPSGGWTSAGGIAAKAIPSFVYKFAGMDPKTGEVLKPPKVVAPAGSEPVGGTNVAEVIQKTAEAVVPEPAKITKSDRNRQIREKLARDELKRMEEELKQSELFIKTGGKQGKDTVWNRGDDVKGEEGDLANKKAAIAKKKAALVKLTGPEGGGGLIKTKFGNITKKQMEMVEEQSRRVGDTSGKYKAELIRNAADEHRYNQSEEGKQYKAQGVADRAKTMNAAATAKVGRDASANNAAGKSAGPAVVMDASKKQNITNMSSGGGGSINPNHFGRLNYDDASQGF